MTSLPESTKALALQQAQRLLFDVAGLTAVVVATADGFDVASAVQSQIEPSRIAAMASSISAISEVVSQEARLGRGKCVTIDTEAGFAVLHAVHRADVPLVINVIANEDAILGQVTYRAAQLARTLAAA